MSSKQIHQTSNPLLRTALYKLFTSTDALMRASLVILAGCVSRLSIGGSSAPERVDLHSPTALAVGVSDCETCGDDDGSMCKNSG